jgi:AcrR family transcriptional regulator
MPAARKSSTPTLSPAERIVSAASELFARHGFDGTTTRMIAERAQMNEALIFRYFPNKRELYAAIIERKMAADPVLADLEGNSSLSIEALLEIIAQRILRTIKEDPQFLRLLYYSGLENHSLSAMFFDNYSQRCSRFLASRLEAAMDTGALRRMDPYLCARAFIGMVAHHALAAEIFGLDADRWPEAELTCSFVQLFLNGVKAP